MEDFVTKELVDRVLKLEKDVVNLRALMSATGNPPIGRGELLFPPGDPIPSRSQQDLNDGKLYSMLDGKLLRPFAFVKNTSGKTLNAGDKFAGGIIDTALRAPCEPNNFCLLEI